MKNAIFTATIITLSLFTASAAAQIGNDGWVIVEGAKTANGLEFTTLEKHPSGKTRTTSEFYFSHKPSLMQGSRIITKDKDGKLVSTVYSRWDSDGRKIASGAEYYDSRERTRQGERWFVREDNGTYTGPKIYQVFNERTREWETIQKAETVRIMFAASREAEAKTAARKLTLDGYKVDLRQLTKTEENDASHRGKLYFQGTATNRETAVSIAYELRDIETLEAITRPAAAAGAASADYSLWLLSKNVTERFQGVFMNPFGTLIGIKVEGESVRVGFAEKVAEARFAWKSNGDNFRVTPTFDGSEIRTSIWTGCAVEGKIKDEKDVPIRLVFGEAAFKFQLVKRAVRCELGQVVITDNWEVANAGPYSMEFFKVSFDAPSDN